VYVSQLKVGSINTVLHIAILLLAINTWGHAFFELDQFPKWALNVDSIIGPAANATATLTNGTISL